MNKRLSPLSRVITLICGLSLIAVLFWPIWRIELDAPQYPEGLVLQIYADKLGGDVEVVNGLNHYIGMRTLHTRDFVEFVVLPYIIGALALFGVLTALINRKWFFLVWLGFIVLFGIISMIDFYRWNYNYGHNLDPAAPIQVPGMTYQPPLIGYKQLLNFGAYSIPDTGGWVFVLVGLLLIFVLFRELRKNLRFGPRRSAGAIAVVLMLTLSSCNSGPQPIVQGKDACHFCKMTITDARYANELVTEKGKVYKFDDLHCLDAFLKSDEIKGKENNKIYFVDYSSGEFVTAQNAVFLNGGNLRSPMGSNTAVFASSDSVTKFQQELNAEKITWNEP